MVAPTRTSMPSSLARSWWHRGGIVQGGGPVRRGEGGPPVGAGGDGGDRWVRACGAGGEGVVGRARRRPPEMTLQSFANATSSGRLFWYVFPVAGVFWITMFCFQRPSHIPITTTTTTTSYDTAAANCSRGIGNSSGSTTNNDEDGVAGVATTVSRPPPIDEDGVSVNGIYPSMASPDSGDKPFHWPHYDGLDDRNFQIHGRSSILVVAVVFSVLLLILLCLYAKWVCRHRRLAAAVGAASFQRESPSAPGLVTLVVAGLDGDAINRLPVHVMGSSAEEVQCSICLCNLVEGDKVKVLPGFNHRFHPECVHDLPSGSPCGSANRGRLL